jgi:hypothetical protein
VNEPTGTFDTEIQIEDKEKVFEIPYHTKYKRTRQIRRKKKIPGLEEIPEEPKDDPMELDADDEEDQRFTFLLFLLICLI